MKKLEKIWWTAITIAELGIIAFWIFGFKECMTAAGISLHIAGVAAAIAFAALGVQRIRCYQGF